MNFGTGILFFSDFVDMLKVTGVLLPDGTFDESKVDVLAEQLEFVNKTTVLLAKYGLNVPANVATIIDALPLIAKLAKLA